MKEETSKLLDKAERTILAAETLFNAGHLEVASGRVYYAMFYVAKALLSEKGQSSFRKHSAVHSAFGKTFTVSGLLQPKFHRWLLDAFDKRLKGDYDVDLQISAEDISMTLSQAREFLAEASWYLSQ